MLPEGQQLSHYRLVRFLKSGGMGEVYLAVDMLLQRQVAIKVIHTDSRRYAETDAIKEATRLFLREAQAIAQLDHINILPVYDSGEEYVSETTLMYMVMPYRREGSLKDWLRTHLGQELLPLRAVERIMRQAAFALQHAHDRQIIHQDVKPANFLVYGETEDPGRLNLQLADFGVAKFMMKTSDSQSIRGTPVYMAPEQWEGHPVPATDQYALAVMSYELLTGRPPFVGNGYQNIWFQHHHVMPLPPSMVNPKLPKDLDVVFLCALAKKPENRYSSVSAFAQAFTVALQNRGDIHQTVTISMLEARTGTNRVIALSTGQQVMLSIPAGAYNGQVMRLEGYGRPSAYNGPKGALVVTISVISVDAVVSPTNSTVQQKAPTPVAGKQVVRPTSPRQTPRTRQFRGNIIIIIAIVLFLLTGGISFYYVRGSGSTLPGTATTTAPTPTPTLIPATATAIAANPYPSYLPGHGTLALYDPLQTHIVTPQGYDWAQPSNDLPLQNGGCQFQEGIQGQGVALHVWVLGDTNHQVFFHPCGSDKPHNFKNFAYQIKMTFIEGDCGGVTFRINGSMLYYFNICQDGQYSLVRYTSNSDTSKNIPLRTGSSPYILAGSGQPYIIAVLAQDSHIILYVNRYQIDSVDDICYPDGSTIGVPCFRDGAIGVLAKSFKLNTRTEIAFSDATVWIF